MRLMSIALIACSGLAATASAQQARPTPYWASLAASEVMMRTGPGTNYPGTWRYVRDELPIRVLQVRGDWRRIEDPAGAQGWMAARLLSEQRTALVIGDVRPMRAAPDRGAKVNWRAAAGVVGKIAHCAAGWCEFEVRGRAGYIETAHIWGVGPDEVVE